MKTPRNMKSQDRAAAAPVPDQRGSAHARAAATTRDRVGLELLTIIPVLYTILALPFLGVDYVDVGKAAAFLFVLGSLLINPATAVLGVRVAAKVPVAGARRLAQLGSALALIALVPMFQWEDEILWPLYLGCGLTLAAVALIAAASLFLWDYDIIWPLYLGRGPTSPAATWIRDRRAASLVIGPRSGRIRRLLTLARALALTVCAGAVLGAVVSAVK